MADRIELIPNQTILFTGDSITDAGRRQAGADRLGSGYVFIAANMLIAENPELNLRVVNTGISGDTTRSLKWRWKRDCLQYRPDIVSLMIGINDIWYLHDDAVPEIKGVGVDEYEWNCRYMLDAVQTQCGSQIVLMEPFMFCDDADNAMFRDLAKYIAVVRRLAVEFGAVLVKLQADIDRQIGRIPSDKWSDDMVHPYAWAHAWIARHWLDACRGGS
jgi:lysophospholipase L1-like esterase